MAIFSNDTMVFQRVCHLLTTTIAFFLQLNHSNGTESSQIQNLPIVDSGLKWPKYIVESSTYCENFGRRGHCENRVFIHSGGRKTTFREAEGGFRGDFSPSQFTQFVRFCAKKNYPLWLGLQDQMFPDNPSLCLPNESVNSNKNHMGTL